MCAWDYKNEDNSTDNMFSNSTATYIQEYRQLLIKGAARNYGILNFIFLFEYALKISKYKKYYFHVKNKKRKFTFFTSIVYLYAYLINNCAHFGTTRLASVPSREWKVTF